MDAVLARGNALFLANFNDLDGAGRPTSTGTGSPRQRRSNPQNFNRISSPESNSCNGCHNKPRPGGGGDNVANVFVLAQRFSFVNFDQSAGDHFQKHTLKGVGDERATIGMFGSGYIELLAREITTELQDIRDAAIADAQRMAQDVTVPLSAKGIDYGSITAKADGSVDTSGVEGVDGDLIIKPFHQKGVAVSLREFTNNAMNHHHGMQAVERFGLHADPDGDGVIDELTIGDMTAITLMQATLPAPGRVLPGKSGPQREAADRGEQLFSSLGCAECHVPSLELEDPVFREPNPFNPVGNLRPEDVSAEVEVDLTQVGPGPHLMRGPRGAVTVHAYTDFKRHDMGKELDTEQLEQNGVPTSYFLTKRLWGMANEAPFMHHGRATTIKEAILMHGGEAKVSREAFARMSESGQNDVVEFLKTLQVLPENAKYNKIVVEPSGIIGDEPAMPGHLDEKDIEAGSYTIEQLSAIGRKIFGADFNTLDGAGRPETDGTGQPRPRREAPENFNRISGPDSNACVGCHRMPAIGGGGDNVGNVFVLGQRFPFVNFDGGAGDSFLIHNLTNVGNERNTLGMWGSGYIEMLAREMTADLHAIRDKTISEAKRTGRSVTVQLLTKGISFGWFTCGSLGGTDLSKVEGIDDDLIVKPFHQKGVVVSLREFTNNAINQHHGMQPEERFGKGVDADKDGVVNEITVGDMTALTLFQALLPVPTQVMPEKPEYRASVEVGQRLFATIGCTACHVPSLVLDDPVFTEPNPYNPAGNLQVKDVSHPIEADLTVEGQGDRLSRRGDGKVEVPAYTDLKRHYLGPECDNELLMQAGVPTGQFLTKKLWGMASEPPFLHHGRALTLRKAIEMHGGEANDSRTAFNALSDGDQKSVIDFLKTLQVPSAK